MGWAARSTPRRCRSPTSARAVWRARGADAVAEAVTGGDDYELAFTVRPKDARRLTSGGRARSTACGSRGSASSPRTPGAGWWMPSGDATPIGRDTNTSAADAGSFPVAQARADDRRRRAAWCGCTRSRSSTRGLRRCRARGDPSPSRARRPAALQRHRLLQGHDDRLWRQRALRHRRRRSRLVAGRLGGAGGCARRALRRRLHGDGHRPEGAGPAPRPLHVELPRGAPLRPHRHPHRRAAAWMESDAQRSRPGGFAVQAARDRRARAPPPSAAAHPPARQKTATAAQSRGRARPA